MSAEAGNTYIYASDVTGPVVGGISFTQQYKVGETVEMPWAT